MNKVLIGLIIMFIASGAYGVIAESEPAYPSKEIDNTDRVYESEPEYRKKYPKPSKNDEKEEEPVRYRDLMNEYWEAQRKLRDRL